ncbi:MAG: HAMP domain-containing histidine kinase [Clostridia bacterium]|nr:HAMP domain-containing histidine kinase [Clostridia bacterium]
MGIQFESRHNGDGEFRQPSAGGYSDSGEKTKALHKRGFRSWLAGIFVEMKHIVSRSLFTKYLFVTSTVLICSLILFSIIMSALISNRWRSEKQQQLADNAHIVADRMNAYIIPVPMRNGDDSMNPAIQYVVTDAGKEKLRSTLGILSSSCGADIFIVDAQGTTVICSEEYLHADTPDNEEFRCRHQKKSISQSVISAAAKVREYRMTDRLGGIYDQSHFIVAVPFVAGGDVGKEYIAGFVFVASSASAISDFRSDISRIAVVAVLIAGIISFCMVYMLTYQQVKPLREMVKAAQKYSDGDFAMRINFKSENEVGQLADALNEMGAKLAESETVNRSFIANISHELKTPMTNISGYVNGILDGTIPPEKQDKYLRIISDETKRLARLVRSMLDLSKIDSGAMQLKKQKFNLSEVIFQALLSFEHRIEEKHIEIQGFDELGIITVNGDADLIHQVLYNLFDNAVKFTNDGGYIRVKATVQNKVATVSISNSGIGVSTEELSHIFERFYKTDKSRSFDRQGVGLGLYIVKTIVTLHGGRIHAEGSEGNYCSIIFTLPEASEGSRSTNRAKTRSDEESS